MNREDAQAIPIFAMTTNAFIDDISQSHVVGMNEHLTKPLSMEKLEKTLRKYLS